MSVVYTTETINMVKSYTQGIMIRGNNKEYVYELCSYCVQNNIILSELKYTEDILRKFPVNKWKNMSLALRTLNLGLKTRTYYKIREIRLEEVKEVLISHDYPTIIAEEIVSVFMK